MASAITGRHTEAELTGWVANTNEQDNLLMAHSDTLADHESRLDALELASGVSGGGASTPATAPGAPTSVSASAGALSAVVMFTPPANTGGAAITGYTVTSSPGGITASRASSPITVPGLAASTAYTFTAKATNSVGTGPASAASAAITPLSTVPDTVTAGSSSYALGGVNTASKVAGGLTMYTSAFGATIPAPANTLAGVLQTELIVINGSIDHVYDRAATAGGGGAGPDGRSLVPTPIPSNGYVLVGDGIDSGTGGSWIFYNANTPGTAVVLSSSANAGAAPGTAPAGGTVTGKWISGESDNTSFANGSFAAWRGRAVEIGGTWASSANSNDANASAGWTVGPGGPWATAPRMDYAIGALFAGESWAQAAAGNFDSRWGVWLESLKSAWGARAASNMYIRFAHEMNGNWYNWTVPDGQQANFIAAHRRFYAQVQAHFPGAKTVWCPNAGSSYSYGFPSSLYPGSAYVDVIGVDSYNNYPWANDFNSWTAKINSVSGLETWRKFALAQGKPLCVSEWSNAAVNNQGGGGDAPNFAQYYHDWLALNGGTGAGNVLYEVLFNVTGYADHYEVYQNGQPSAYMPQFCAKYKALWSVV